MKLRCLVVSVLLSLLALGFWGISIGQAEGVNDPPYFSRLSSYDALKDANKNGLYDTYNLWTDKGAMTVEGKVWSTTYSIRSGINPSRDLEIIRHYSNETLKKDGSSIIFDGRDDSGRRDITGKFLGKDKKVIWVETVAWNGGDDYRLTVIETK